LCICSDDLSPKSNGVSSDAGASADAAMTTPVTTTDVAMTTTTTVVRSSSSSSDRTASVDLSESFIVQVKCLVVVPGYGEGGGGGLSAPVDLGNVKRV